MKLSIINYEDKVSAEIYTLKTRNNFEYEIIINHEMHETIIFDKQSERILSTIYGVYLNVALVELNQFIRLWQT